MLLALGLTLKLSAAPLTLRWGDTSSNEYGFRIERADSAAGPFVQIATTGPGVTSYVDDAPAYATTYVYRVRAFNAGGDSGYSNTATGTTPPPPNAAPVISAIADQVIPEDGATAALAFTIADNETPAASLVLSAASSNSALVPNGNLVLSGTGGARAITVRPLANQSGSTEITVQVTDGALVATRRFTVTVQAVNDAPTVSALGSRTLQAGASGGPVSFTIGDVETAAAALSVSATSSNTSLLPNANLVLGGSGATRTLAFSTPPTGGGTVAITVRVSDGESAATSVLTVTLTPANTAPTISAVANRTVATGVSSGAIGFVVGDAESPAANLVVGASSSNPDLLPDFALVLGGSGAARTLLFTPPTTLTGGTATVTLRVSDGSLNATTSFLVTVDATNTAPTISAIPAQNIAMNTTTGPLAFTIGDTQTPAGALTLITNASNQALVPLDNITVEGSGAARTITIRPAYNTTGWSTIWVKVSDGALTRTISFVVNVSAVMDFTNVGAPVLTGSQSITGGTTTLTAGGTDIWGGTDQFRFGSLALLGDSELTVRLTSLTKSHDWAKVGLMYRDSTDANAAYVFVCVTPSNGVALQYRSAAGKASAQKYVTSGAAPRWLKLTRSGNTFYAFQSTDGAAWELLDFVTVDLGDTAAAGVAATAHSDATAITAVFDNFSVD